MNPLRGRLGNHRFHPMLVHFPSALYPFSFTMDLLCRVMERPDFAFGGLCALVGAVGMSLVAAIYGSIDFLQIDPKSKAWRTALVHGLLNASWLMVFTTLLFYRIKHPEVSCGWVYLTIMGLTTLGLFFSNYLGAELIIKHRVGIESDKVK